MDLLSREEIRRLMDAQDAACISIYMPTHRVWPETQQDPIRLKNHLGKAEERLIESGMRSAEARDLLHGPRELVGDIGYWKYQSDGLAVFIDSGRYRAYRLPLHFDDMLIVSTAFYLKPLLPLLTGDGRFYVLALSQNEVRLMQGTRYSVAEIQPENIPENLAEALRADEIQKHLQFHTGTPDVRGGERRAMYHGHGAPEEDVKQYLRQYFRQIDRGVQEFLEGGQWPLIIAGVDYLFPIYREVSTYPRLMQEGIEGNPEALSAEDLHKSAWQIVGPHFKQEQEAAAARYSELRTHGRASKDVAEIVPAAYYGRVETLFVELGAEVWGAFDPDTSTVSLRERAETPDLDLSDRSAALTFLNGGTVYVVDRSEMPEEGPLAAIYRY